MEEIIKELKRKPLFASASGKNTLAFGSEDIKAIIPHRSPFLLIDSLVALNLKEQIIKGERFIEAGDPVFAGHFPDKPIYPGVLQIETIAQAGLCLAYFVLNNTSLIHEQNKPVEAMITKLHYAAFNRPVLPNQILSIHSKILHYDDITGMIAGQIYYDQQLCSYAIMECYFND